MAYVKLVAMVGFVVARMGRMLELSHDVSILDF